MKKVLCLLISVSFTILLSAKSIITLKTGDVSIFSKSAKAVVEFDYDSAEIEDKDMSLEDFVEQKGSKYEARWEVAQNMAHKDFIKRFNKKSTNLKFSADSTSETKYKVTIKVKTINLGNSLKSLVPFGSQKDGGITIFGRIYIKDTTGNELCQLRFTGIQGLGAAGLEARLLLTYQELHSALRKFLNKSKNSSKEEEEEEED